MMLKTASQSLMKRMLGKPSTRLGRWSVWLGTTFVVLFMINAVLFMSLPAGGSWRQVLLPVYAIVMLLCGLLGGIVGLYTVVRYKERSLTVWFSIFLGLFVVVLVLGEFLGPH